MTKPEKAENAYSPREQSIYDSMIAAVRVRHESRRTGEAYAAAVVWYFRFLKRRRDLWKQPSETKVQAWLTDMAPHCTASTQKQRLCAVKRYYEQVIGQPLGDLGPWAYAKVAPRLPVWLNPTETQNLLNLIPDQWSLMARLCYGSGLRLMELMRLRIQHIDLETRTLFVIGGKGNKDRTVPLAESLVADLAAHLQRVRSLWEGDRSRGTPPVHLPNGLERKYPNAGHEWVWFWAFPGRNLSTDPATGQIRRHHVHANGFQKVIKRAAERAGIGKRVKVHTLRHTFASHFIAHGGDVVVLQKLLGHKRLETTMIYVHCQPTVVTGACSPLDQLQAGSAVVPFVAPGVPALRSAVAG